MCFTLHFVVTWNHLPPPLLVFMFQFQNFPSLCKLAYLRLSYFVLEFNSLSNSLNFISLQYEVIQLTLQWRCESLNWITELLSQNCYQHATIVHEIYMFATINLDEINKFMNVLFCCGVKIRSRARNIFLSRLYIEK